MWRTTLGSGRRGVGYGGVNEGTWRVGSGSGRENGGWTLSLQQQGIQRVFTGQRIGREKPGLRG